MSDPSDPAQSPELQALMDAVNSVLAPLARLAVARGVQFSAVEEVLKIAFVQAAREANPGGLPHRQVSRISTTTGINRREVTRLVTTNLRESQPRRSLAGEVYAHWLTDPVYREINGQPSPLRRQGPEPSFETLARTVTSDVHPRSLLSEMLRLGYAETDEGQDTVHVVREALVPKGDLPRSLRILGANVGGHFSGAVANVLGDGRQHFEQAIVGRGLSDASMVTLRKLVVAQWRHTFDSLVPAMERLIEADAKLDPAPESLQQILIGLYSFNKTDASVTEAAEPTGDGAPESGV